MRLAVYAGTSALVAAGALLKAFHQRPNFYSATVYLSQSNACVLILTNLALVCACTFIYGLQRLFYGPLRQIEIEQLTEKAWYAVLDTLLAMPSLSHDVSGWMLAIFVLLLAGKVWGWIGEGRVDILEQQPPQNPRAFHARLSSSLIVSVLFGAAMLQYCIKTVRDDPRPGMMVIFTFEFAILTIFSLFTLARYSLAVIEARILKAQMDMKIQERKVEIRAERERLQQEYAQATSNDGASAPAPPNLPSEDDIDENEIDVPGWEEKRRWLFGLELATDFTKLIIYTVFFAISLTFMGLPMHIMRDVYLTFSAFAKRIQDYSNYRKATQNMNDRYSDATAEELNNDNTCIVCREAMLPYGPEGNAARPNESLRAKKLPCGHILHLRCLKAWLERQQTCPTCRRPVVGGQASGATVPGQPRIEGPNAAPQAGPAAGGNAPPAGNDPAPAPGQPQQRANRLRMLNLGPIRIGLYNGPAHQIQEALGQRRNVHAPAAPTGANTASAPNATLGSQSTQIQLMQVEERLLHQARQLAVEQTQLATVRALEAELARLRGLHDRTQQGTQAVQAMANLPPQALPNGLMGMPLHMPMPMPMPGHMPFGGHQLPQALQPIPGQAPMGAGHPNLPQGIELPEGWSVTPLHPIGGPPQQQHSATSSQPPVAVPESDHPPAETISAAPVPQNTAEPTPPFEAATRTPEGQTTQALPQAPQAPQGPEDLIRSQIEAAVSQALRPQIENAINLARARAAHAAQEQARAAARSATLSPSQADSPTPTIPPSSGTIAIGESAPSSVQTVTAPSLTPTSETAQAPLQPSAEETAPAAPLPLSSSTASSSWNFNDIDEQHESERGESHTPSEEDEASGSNEDSSMSANGGTSSSVDKGKGRAVTMEDVQDADE